METKEVKFFGDVTVNMIIDLIYSLEAKFNLPVEMLRVSPGIYCQLMTVPVYDYHVHYNLSNLHVNGIFVEKLPHLKDEEFIVEFKGNTAVKATRQELE